MALPVAEASGKLHNIDKKQMLPPTGRRSRVARLLYGVYCGVLLTLWYLSRAILVTIKEQHTQTQWE
jgi:hypothetical protein